MDFPRNGDLPVCVRVDCDNYCAGARKGGNLVHSSANDFIENVVSAPVFLPRSVASTLR